MSANVLTWDPELLARVDSLEWRSRVVVQGFLQGMHRSRLRGFSSEFAQYHSYNQGDDVRHVDWRAFARFDRLYIRTFEAETNLRAQLVLDASASMDYRSGDVRFRKYDYAAMLAAAIMRLFQRQNDAFGISIARDTLAEHHPARLSTAHFLRCLGAMEAAQPKGRSDLHQTILALAELIPQRGLVILLTDAWDDLDNLNAALQRLRFDHHEVCLFHIADPRELDFAFSESDIFEDLETGQRLAVTPKFNRPRYLDGLHQHLAALENLCLTLGVEYHRLTTMDAPFEALAQFLGQRGRVL